MAILCCPVNPRAATSVDPKMEAVAVIEPRFAAPGKLAFAIHRYMDAQAFAAPTHPNIGEHRTIVQTTERGEATLGGQFKAPVRPLAFRLLNRNFKTE